MLKQQIEQDLKAALLSGNKSRASTLRSVKSAILYEEVSKGAREQGLNDEEIQSLLTKEAKKRQESADLYQKGGDDKRTQAELEEKALIESYLPKQLSGEELDQIIDEVIDKLGVSDVKSMGRIIGEVKQKATGQADGARIAQAVKERIQ